ncbi:MAG: extracellular solute-binding protein [Acidimicrobiales bacterium]
MIRRRRWWAGRLRALVTLALVAGLLVACSATPASPTVLRVLMTDDWVTAPFLDAVREFERAHPNVRVEIDRGPISRMADAVRAAIATGSPPDVVQGHAFAAAAQGLAQPVDDLWAEHLEKADFFDGAIDDVAWAGRLYGIPLDTNAMVLIYDNEALASAGVPPPTSATTFADFKTMATRLSSPDGARRAIAFPTSTWWTYGWIAANGGDLVRVGSDGRVELTLDSPAVVQALQYLSDLVAADAAVAPRGGDSSSGDALALFQSGKVAIHASGSWDLALVRKEPAGAKYAAAFMPWGPAGERPAATAMGGSSLFVPTGSSKRELAFDFMARLTSDTYARRFAAEQGRLPVRLRLYEDPLFQDPAIRVFVEQLKTARPPKLGAYPEASLIFADAIDRILRLREDPAKVLGEAQRKAMALPLGPR